VDQDAGGIGAVVGVAAEVRSAVGDDAFPAGGGEALGDDQSGEAGADDQEIHGGKR
jgi:hypothetical protein